MTVTDAAVNAAAEAMVRELFGRTCRVGSMHREVARLVLEAAEPHRQNGETQPARDGSSTLSAVTERAPATGGQPASWRAPVPPRPPIRASFGFGRP